MMSKSPTDPEIVFITGSISTKWAWAVKSRKERTSKLSVSKSKFDETIFVKKTF